ncbi:zinc knuckle CX2CX4HX4C containing protein, partial [Tanacetum coccineum]
ARALVDIRVDRALKDTMVISVPNSNGNSITTHTIKVEYEWKPSRCETCLVFGHDDAQCPKRVIDNLRNLRKRGGTSNDGFQIVQRKGVRAPLVIKHRTRGHHSLPKQQVPKPVYQKKMTSILMSNAFSALKEDNRKLMDDLVDGIRKNVGAPPRKTWHFLESDDDADVKNGYDETITLLFPSRWVTLWVETRNV